jgi:hypothetical protein
MTGFLRSFWQRGVFYVVAGVCVSFVVLTTMAMVFYAGGTYYDPTTAGYSFFNNPFSDLGLTRSLSGQPNTVSSILFTVALLLAGGGVILFSAAFHQFFRRSMLGKVLGGIGAFFGVITGICFAGVGLTPWDVNGPLHGNFVLTAFSAFTLAAIFYAATILHDRQYPRRFAAVLIVFAVLLALYIVLMFTAPLGDTPAGGMIQTTGQKIIVYASILSIFIEAVGALQVGRGRLAVKAA